MVGFVMYWFDEANEKLWIDRLMVDKKYQGNGYGKRAMKMVDEYLNKDKCRLLRTSFDPKNIRAKKVYGSTAKRSILKTYSQNQVSSHLRADTPVPPLQMRLNTLNSDVGEHRCVLPNNNSRDIFFGNNRKKSFFSGEPVYESLGFKSTGEICNGEEVMVIEKWEK